MRKAILREITTFQKLQADFGGKAIDFSGFLVYVAPNLLPPNNRVTQSFAQAIRSENGTTALDLGCGTGILAMIASQRAHWVVGIDNNIKAVKCARLNAHINHINNIDFYHGKGFDPVKNRKFDLIICNPPFYPAMQCENVTDAICLQGDESQDLLFQLIQGIPQHLTQIGKSLFVTSSLSENDLVRKRLIEQNLAFKTSILARGRHQEILLWTIRLK